MRGAINDIDNTARKLSRLVLAELDVNGRAKDVLITAFLNSTDFNETKARFERLKSAVIQLDEKDLLRIAEGFNQNDPKGELEKFKKSPLL